MSLLAPPLAVALMFGFSWGLFALTGRLRAKEVSEDEKPKVYFCGEEEAQGEKEQNLELNPEYRRFFATAFLFTIMEVGALFLGTIPKGHGILLPMSFLCFLLLSVGAILVEVFQER
ncbi:MAG TPA: hypothetical protein GXX30_05830 [Firmicutes bacterium]|uniref:NADH-quinone oxidoreductase subunit n=1 Tax=Candidatus Fermentithermobacillus carboniphilus TaxID=3085328 RepID=A0AAT9LBN4_9FIRM|nr:MAG: hypothetical protein IMF26_06230 [Candidatus Fermentithermobacillus carboniphilus]HHW18403.1 hypothetical protein [Candidatus Fermentithermobacillaceae bacterium]